MKIIGIDPGINKAGYGVLNENLKVLESGIFKSPLKLSFENKIKYLLQNFETLIENFSPDYISIEEIYVAKNVQVALKIGILIGGIIGISISRNVKFFLIPPREIKQLITGKGGATKQQVKFMVENLTNYYNFKSFEETDAVATAISAIFKLKENAILYKR
ncbi:MAG: crossover junction endodeoxyribonuclease RuvC [bacterium]|nr:crossover junction endodeoxyribonuclease RuvC [bacterium]MCX7917498.1 crossover junction endodeoxyribonuclease RuvC [bacterium]MDW8164883.1 crossover junction endodeoxyribonuclease RuvC [Candidatus Omnitrophota bacterium]